MSLERAGVLKGYGATYAAVFYLSNEKLIKEFIGTTEGKGALYEGELLAQRDLNHRGDFNQPKVGLDKDMPTDIILKNVIIVLAYEKTFKKTPYHIWENIDK